MMPPNAKGAELMNGKRSAEQSLGRQIKVALVEDQPKVRESWTKLINFLPDFACDCACATAEEALRIIPRAQPDVVPMDIFLPRMSGIECTAQLKKLQPQMPIVILTAM